MNALPKINAAYWTTLGAASVFGTNTGDFVSDQLKIGHLAGLPWLAAVLVILFLAARYSSWKSAIFFWLIIITVRTAATNVGDAFHDFGIGFGTSLPIVLLLFAMVVGAYARFSPARAVDDNNIRVSPLYWVCMIMAGVLGTIGGDAASFGVGLTTWGTALVFGVAAILGLFAWRNGRILQPIYYWITLALIRTAGTGGGDAFAHLLGLTSSTLVTGAVFFALVAYFYWFSRSNTTESGFSQFAPAA